MKRKQILNTITITMLGSLFFSACQKSDITAVNTTDQQTEEKFFNSHIATKPATRAVQEYIRRENGRRPVVKGLLQKAGIPRWDKALIFDNVELPSGRGSALGDSTTILHIPFVPENGNMVRGSLMVKMEPGDTTMNLVNANDYASYGFGNATANAWNARDVFNILTRLDYEVFGRTKYIVNDGRIVGDSQHIRHKVTIDQTPQQTLNDLFVTLAVTNSQTVCIIAGEPGSSPGVCNTYFYTTYYYIEIPDGGGTGGGSGGGTGGGPTGGGGTGGGPIGWVPLEDPVGTTCTQTANAIFASASALSSKESVELVSSSGDTRTKRYNWKVYTVSNGLIPMYLVSEENGEHSQASSGRWSFVSLTHIGIRKVGTEILYSVAIDNVNAVSSILPHLGIPNQVGKMQLSFAVKISVVCEGLPIVYNGSASPVNMWHVSE